MINIAGDIAITNSVEDLEQFCFSHKIICVGEMDRDLSNRFAMIAMPIFMPPYDAIQAEIDGDMYRFNSIYYSYLNSSDCQEYMALLFRSMLDGKKLLLYLSKDESEMQYIQSFRMYMKSTFGLTISTDPNIASVCDTNYTDVILGLLYVYRLISGYEYLMYTDRISAFSNDEILLSLIQEFNPPVLVQTKANYMNYFNNFRLDMRRVNRPIIPGLCVVRR